MPAPMELCNLVIPSFLRMCSGVGARLHLVVRSLYPRSSAKTRIDWLSEVELNCLGLS